MMNAANKITYQRTHLMRTPLNNYLLKNGLMPSYKHTCPMKIKGSAKKLLGAQIASDDTGIHTQGVEITCEKDDCAKLKCPSGVCSAIKSVKVAFYATHKPIVGKFSAHISDLDAKGNNKPQYITRGYKTMTAEEYKTRIENGTLVKDVKFEALMEKYPDKFQ